MAPTSCRYSPLHRDENPKKLGARKLPVWVGIVAILLGLLVVGLSVAVGVLTAKANSPACKDGLRAEQECRNITHLLEQELTQAQDALQRTEAKVVTCNQTVETLKISLEEEKAGGRMQQELVQKLQEQIKSLNHSQQEKSAEVDKKSAELDKKSSELVKKSSELDKKSAELDEKSAELDKKSVELDEKSAELDKKSAELDKKSVELDEKSADQYEKSVELQDKSQELEKQRQENEALLSAKCPPNSGISLRLSVTPAGPTVLVLLTLSLLALLA